MHPPALRAAQTHSQSRCAGAPATRHPPPFARRPLPASRRMLGRSKGIDMPSPPARRPRGPARAGSPIAVGRDPL
eukprot:1874110-Alexandrium_andersonii.AAC.1